jgi:hypothetical protein
MLKSQLDLIRDNITEETNFQLMWKFSVILKLIEWELIISRMRTIHVLKK